MREACHGCKEDGSVLLLGKGSGCCKEFVGLAHVGAWLMLMRPKSCCGAQDMLVGACEWAGRGPGP
jgi:hypothetical protein